MFYMFITFILPIDLLAESYKCILYLFNRVRSTSKQLPMMLIRIGLLVDYNGSSDPGCRWDMYILCLSSFCFTDGIVELADIVLLIWPVMFVLLISFVKTGCNGSRIMG